MNHILLFLECISTLLAGDSFPSLVVLTVQLVFPIQIGEQSVLELIVASLTSPSTLQHLCLQCLDPICTPEQCGRLVGGLWEEASESQRLRERLPHLRSLLVVIQPIQPWTDSEETMEGCVVFCYNTLPELRSILRFMRHARSGSITEYTVPQSIRRQFDLP